MFCWSIKCSSNLRQLSGKCKSGFKFIIGWRRNHSETYFPVKSRQLVRNSPKIMKLDSALFKSCLNDEVKILRDLFAKNGHEIRIVGGAVRDMLMGVQPLDLDFSTTATPEEMKQMLSENQLRLINTRGEKHGTITARINDKNFEITTLRVDLATNGRHAIVEFTKEWVLDANRRDLTINAMYLGLDGTVYDYFNGIEDLKNRKLVFVGNASERIQEDYLRILRYFRFYGKIAELPDRHDEDILKAIVENADGLEKIAGERIWCEINKIFQGKFVGDIILKIVSLGIGPYIGFPKKPNESQFRKVWDRLKMKDVEVKPMTLLSALFDFIWELDDFCFRIKPSNIEKDLAYFIINHRSECVNSIRWYQILMINLKHNRYFVYELMKYNGDYDYLEELKTWKIPVFPVSGHMLLNKGIKGKEINLTMKHLKQIWCDHEFSISAEELLQHVSENKEKTIEK